MEKSEFRDYDAHSQDHVAKFYRDNHRFQTLEFARDKAAQYGSLDRKLLSTWEAMFILDELQDESDPDTELSQLDHSLQTAEAMRADGLPRWLQLTGLIHDLGKVLCLYDEPQWAVVGDTFPLGCKFDPSIVYYQYFEENPDHQQPEYQTDEGIYRPHCGFDQITMSWGHDEYLYQVMRPYLPPEALYVIRYHSFYSAHSHGAYQHLMSDHDRNMMPWVQRFQPYDLYSKSEAAPNRTDILSYYQELVAEFLPDQLHW